MRIISLILLAFTLCSISCAQSAKTNESQTLPKQDFSKTSQIDAEKAREFSDSLTKAITGDRYQDIYSKMEQPFRKAIAEKDLKQGLEKLYAQYGKPLEVEYKMTNSGVEMFNGQRRSVSKNWYAIKTSKAEKGIYFLFVNIVLNENNLGCSGFSIVSFSKGIPPELK